MAGYIIYSLDWAKFHEFVERPTPGQLTALASRLCDGLEEHEFDEGDPVLAWPTNAKALVPVAAKRLALPDWYGDLTATGKAVWEGAIFGACMEDEGIDLGFRVDNDGIDWDVIELAWKQLGVVPGQISDVTLSAFGDRPFRFHPEVKPPKTRKEHEKEEAERRSELKELQGEVDEFLRDLLDAKASKSAPDPNQMMEELNEGKSASLVNALMGFFDEAQEGSDGTHYEDWQPMHSMHTPDEVRKMLAELRSIEATMRKARKKDIRRQYEEELLPSITTVADDGRMLFIQVDT